MDIYYLRVKNLFIYFPTNKIGVDTNIIKFEYFEKG